MGGRYLASIPALLALACLCASCGPRMVTQISEKPYKAQMPDMPEGTVPITGRAATTSEVDSSLKANPLLSTPEIVDDGRIYYGYYCLMCHGEKGDGNGPVGQSYIPKPTDLTALKVTNLTDGQLYKAMLHGPRHDPVMAQTVLPEHRWPLIHYLRTLR